MSSDETGWSHNMGLIPDARTGAGLDAVPAGVRVERVEHILVVSTLPTELEDPALGLESRL